MLFGNLRDRFLVEGVMPERALLRLKRAGIPLYNVKKTEKKHILFSVKKKDSEKVFAIYPNVCYNITAYHPYTVTKLGGEGLAKWVDASKKRLGFLIGALLFCMLSLGAEPFVLGVEFVGTDVYVREAKQLLAEQGIKPFSVYKTAKEDLVTAKLLALDGVEFCSVQKVGNRVRVEIRTSPFVVNTLTQGAMQAKHEGELVALTVLKGTAVKKIGDTVKVGETLVQNVLTTQDGGQVRVETIARARISCVYEGVHEGAETAEQAFAEAYLRLALGEKDELTSKTITPTQKGFHVKITYLVTESMNL